MNTIRSLRRSLSYRHRLTLIAVLVLSSVAALVLQIIRQSWTNGGRFWHIAWDLFLAWVPLAFAGAMYHANGRGSRNGFWLGSLGLLWLLFFPNAPYLLTEFVHMGPHYDFNDAIWWCDLTVMLCISWVGLLLGFVSLYLVQRVIEQWTNLVVSWLAVLLCLGIGSFGITLGRFQRLNSWNAISDPRELVNAMHLFLDARTLRHNIGLSVLLASFLTLAYLALVALMAVGRDERTLLEERHRVAAPLPANHVSSAAGEESTAAMTVLGEN